MRQYLVLILWLLNIWKVICISTSKPFKKSRLVWCRSGLKISFHNKWLWVSGYCVVIKSMNCELNLITRNLSYLARFQNKAGCLCFCLQHCAVIKGTVCDFLWHLKYLQCRVRGFPGGLVVDRPSAMQGTLVQSLVLEDPTCPGATEPICRNSWSPHALEPVLLNERVAPACRNQRKPSHSNRDPAQPINN